MLNSSDVSQKPSPMKLPRFDENDAHSLLGNTSSTRNKKRRDVSSNTTKKNRLRARGSRLLSALERTGIAKTFFCLFPREELHHPDVIPLSIPEAMVETLCDDNSTLETCLDTPSAVQYRLIDPLEIEFEITSCSHPVHTVVCIPDLHSCSWNS